MQLVCILIFAERKLHIIQTVTVSRILSTLTQDHCLLPISSCCPVQSRPWPVSYQASGYHQSCCGCSSHTCRTPGQIGNGVSASALYSDLTNNRVENVKCSLYLVEVFSRYGDFQVMDSIKLHLEAKVCVQKEVGSAGYHLGSRCIYGEWGPHTPPIQLKHHTMK